MSSTCNVLTVASVMKRIDDGQEQPDRLVPYQATDLIPGNSPVTTAHLAAGSMMVVNLCAAAIQWSDETAANLLLRSLGGAPAVTRYVRSLGDDVTRDDLLASYDAVVYATGAMRDRHLGIPGEDLPGSYAATDFVNWYCGHPDVDPFAFTLDAESVAVIGVGNVAVDVARILVRDPAELEGTDVPPHRA